MRETFKPTRFKINLRLFLFIAVICLPFVWATYTGARLLLNGGIEDSLGRVNYIDGYRRVNFQALGYFDLDAVHGTISDIPARCRDLDGKKVALEGFMCCPSSAMRSRDFQFVPGLISHGPPLVQNRIFAHSQVELPLTGDYVRLMGTLHVRVEKNDEGLISSVYTMDVDKWQEM